MVNRKFILNADSFGVSKASNRAVLNGYHNGFLTSASLCANGKAFNAAVNEIIPECPNLGTGVHLNISDGNSLTKAPLLTDKRGKFNNNFLQILLKSNDKNFLEQLEYEFRTQIETVMNYTKIDHINSFNSIHTIPKIFELTAKLAKEYNIPFIRTEYEEIYFVPSFIKHLNHKYLPNFINLLILNNFSKDNKKIAEQYGLRTNKYFIGTAYKGFMDNSTVEYGLKAIEDDGTTEVCIHPCYYTASNKHYTEFMITQNKALKDRIARLGFEITNYKKEYANK